MRLHQSDDPQMTPKLFAMLRLNEIFHAICEDKFKWESSRSYSFEQSGKVGNLVLSYWPHLGGWRGRVSILHDDLQVNVVWIDLPEHSLGESLPEQTTG